MAGIYIPKFNGYMVDVADLVFARCDGKKFFYEEASQTNFSDTVNSITISGGASAQPLAMIDTNRETQFTYTSALFTSDMFEMANTVNAIDQDIGENEAATYTVVTKSSAKVIDLPFEAQATSIYIRGLEYMSGDTPTTGKFTVENVAASGTYGEEGYTAPYTEITFYADDVTVGEDVVVFYKRRVKNAHIMNVLTTTKTSRGILDAYWGVYSDGKDCTSAALKGRWHLHIPRVRVTQMPGFDNSLAA